MANHLAKETSPYLLQHANNPVEWYPWGEEAFKYAKAMDKPILLSIGYSACHWCHVMAHESFENPDIAELMNQNFINVKVDREERPDIDSIYMEAVHAMTSQGGWPLTVFLTPDGKPFYGGTYFPPEGRHGLPAFPSVLQSVIDAYQNHRDDVAKTTARIVALVSATMESRSSDETLAGDSIRQAYVILKRSFDTQNGGFGTAPKCPQPMVLEFLMRYHLRSQLEAALGMVELTLGRMARGGIYDHAGGGFHRYSTDEGWLVPHFEKMLYDQALLSQLYLHAYMVTGKPLYRIVAEETLDYVLREMTDRKGGFYSTQDADSEGVEGKYYLWTAQEITKALGKSDASKVLSYFGVTTTGNFEGRNILHVTSPDVAVDSGLISQAKDALLKAREKRVKPACDDKILASWNGLMLASLAEAACVFERKDYLAAAVADGNFLLKHMMHDGHLRHVYKDGKARIDGYLEDYALVIGGLLMLHQATFKGEWLRHAIKLAEAMVDRFWDNGAGMFYDNDSHVWRQQLIVRPRNVFDSSTPCGSSAATFVLLKLAALTGDDKFQKIAERSLKSVQELMGHQPFAAGNWLCALDFYLSSTKEIAIIGSRSEAATKKLLEALYSTWLPNKVVAAYEPGDSTRMAGLPLLRNREMIDGKPTVYVCQNNTCQTPATTPDALIAQLGGN
jgi:uncharacterized protein YyaL (SSP411 family)